MNVWYHQPIYSVITKWLLVYVLEQKHNFHFIIILLDLQKCRKPMFLLMYIDIDVEEPEPRTCVSIDEWVDVWGTLVGNAKKMDDFPMWLQYYPKSLFDIINRSGEDTNLRLNLAGILKRL